MACVSVPAATAEMERAFSLQPGFRFHPTDLELVSFFLRRKVLGHGGDFIPEVDLYKFEPHQLPGKSFSPSTGDPGAKVEWYFFARRGRKYPTGLRMERATLKGFWKSTGKDRPVIHNDIIVGMKKTLVFHMGRAPGGTRTDWVMHEYRLHPHRPIHDTYALCRVFKKNTVAPSIDVSGDADTDEDVMQSVPGSVDTGKDPIKVESDSNSPDANNYLMQSMLGGGGTNSYPINVESDSECNSPDADNDLMQFMLSDIGTNKDPIQIESMSDYAVMHSGGMQFLIGVGEKDKVGAQFLTGGDAAQKRSRKYVAGGAYMDSGGMQPVTIDTDKDELKSMPSGSNAGEDISWMEFLRGDVYWNQFIPDDGWNCSPDITH